MDHDSSYLADLQLCQECLEGDGRAVNTLRTRFEASTRAYLCSTGASADEADETVSWLWADLLTEEPSRPARLRSYRGTSALQTWLNVVALNRLISRKRFDRHWHERVTHRIGQCPDLDSDAAASSIEVEDRTALIELMREAIERAFAASDPEDFVMLQLWHLDLLEGSELSRMFGCDRGTISRRLMRAADRIQAATLAHIRATDPWLELQWPDFLELCRVATPACFGLDDHAH